MILIRPTREHLGYYKYYYEARGGGVAKMKIHAYKIVTNRGDA